MNNPDRLWFVSDLHFGHAAVIEHCKRPFWTTKDMDEALIANWNRVVGAKDDVWLLGDVSFHRTERSVTKWCNMEHLEALPKLLTEAEVATYLGKSIKWLRENGPAALRFGRSRKYTPESVQAFIEEQKAKCKSTRSTEVASGKFETGSTEKKFASPLEQKTAQRLKASLSKSAQPSSGSLKVSSALSEAS